MRQYHWHQHTSKHIILPQWGNSKTLCGRFWVELTNGGLKAQTAKVQAESGGRDFTSVIQQATVPNVAKKKKFKYTQRAIQRDWIYKATKIVLTDVIRA